MPPSKQSTPRVSVCAGLILEAKVPWEQDGQEGTIPRTAAEKQLPQKGGELLAIQTFSMTVTNAPHESPSPPPATEQTDFICRKIRTGNV